ncbi:hypothetical protein SCB49_13815 [unidentified eubacterium SCB49]|nr:hypothetical protein SCB49_13815 [unidentified eubacterium SCB49]
MLKKLFGSKKTELTNDEVEKEMKVEDGQKLGVSEEMLLFGGFQELNEYYFFEGLFLSTSSYKSRTGATITFSGKKGTFTLPSAIQEFECEYAKPLQRYVSQISFDVTKAQIKKIQDGSYDKVTFTVKKKVFELSKS